MWVVPYIEWIESSATGDLSSVTVHAHPARSHSWRYRVPTQLAVTVSSAIATEVKLLAVTVADSMTYRRIQRGRRNDPEGRGPCVVNH